jgi:hypothetical protein
VPRISAFYGITIYMYYFDHARHNLPHVHAMCQRQEAVYSISDGALLAGSIPPRKAKLVLAWIEMHKAELTANWNHALNGRVPYRIAPLR